MTRTSKDHAGEDGSPKRLPACCSTSLKHSSALRLALIVLAIAVIVSLYDWKTGKVRNDFTNYSLSPSRVLYQGGSPYSRTDTATNYKYLPLNAVLLGPLTALPIPVAQGIWFGLNVGLLIWMFTLHRRFSGGKVPWWVWLIALAITARFFWSNLKLGQWNTSVYCLAFIGLALSKRKPWRGGLLLALAATLKYMPFFFILYLIVKRRWRAVSAMLIGLAVWAFLVPSVVLGPARTVDLLKEYNLRAHDSYGKMRDNFSNGYSFPQLCVAYLSATPREVKDEPVYINVMNLERKTARHIGDFAVFVLLIAIVSISLSAPLRNDRISPGLQLLEIGVWFCLLLLISPEVRNAHLLTLFTSSFGLALLLSQRKRRDWSAWWIGSALTLALVLIIASSKISKSIDIHLWLGAHGGYTAAILFLTAGASVVLLKESLASRRATDTHSQ